MDVIFNAHCPFCEIILAVKQPETPLGSQPWVSRVRAVFSDDDSCTSIGLTGVGLMESRYTLVAPLNGISGPPGTPRRFDFSQYQYRWIYPFHDCCWRILLERLGKGRDRRHIANSLFRQFRCVPIQDGSRFYPYSPAYVDPCAMSVDGLERSIISDWKIHCDVGPPTATSGRASLCNLPLELLHEVVSYLPYSQVRELQRVCRNLAQILARENLPQMFWRGRFLLSFEHDFIFPDLKSKRDWYRLYLGTEFELRNGSSPLVNRKRIRGLIEPIAELMDVEEIASPAGRDCLQYMSGRPLVPPIILSAPPPASDPGTPYTYIYSADRDALYYRIQPLPVQENAHVDISSVKFGNETYTSGLSFPSGLCDLGFCYQRTRKQVKIPRFTNIESIQVVFSPGGLVGLQFHFSDYTSSPWIGKHHGEGTAYGILDIKYPHETRLIMGLDVINIDFGGPGGILLKALTKLVVHMAIGPLPVVGVDFSYADSTVKHFGHRGQNQLTFYVNGPAGERITKIVVVLDVRWTGMSGFEIWTNYGRHASFIPIPSRLKNLGCSTLEVPEAHILTGFAAIVRSRSFAGLAIQTQPDFGDSNDPRCIPDFRKEYLFTDNILSDDTCTNGICDYETYASLRGVRKITVSVRTPRHISGLQIDYYHEQHPPAVVGQWMEKCDAFEISPNEKIRRLDVWLTRPQTYGLARAWYQGNITAIRIVTSLGRVKNFNPSGSDSPEPGENMQIVRSAESGEIAAVSWILNSCHDRIKVYVSTDEIGCAWESRTDRRFVQHPIMVDRVG
ncbi:hypothetical protein FE257_008969 [Aspergillus nanangensis]|uniref:F-box domain-containing protein n=1 Tax=Aspergillus nanangensis TaxID=2582783 RepID=A0AAD4GZT4_ASPNN|nr:hypothetical protein FE257_008969 [Aspergillus nanangensis]